MEFLKWLYCKVQNRLYLFPLKGPSKTFPSQKYENIHKKVHFNTNTSLLEFES